VWVCSTYSSKNKGWEGGFFENTSWKVWSQNSKYFRSYGQFCGTESVQVEPVRLGGFRIIVLPGNGLVKVKKLKMLQKFPKKSGMFLDMCSIRFWHLKLTNLIFCLWKNYSKTYIYLFEKIIFDYFKSKNICLYKDLQVTFQGPYAPRVMIKALEIVWKQFYFSLRLIEFIFYLFKIIFQCPSLCSY